jgi:monoterpene epsilon-lactone hydrolase
LLVQVGSYELLRDDARRYAELAAAKGGEVHLDVFEGLHHVFQRAVADLPSAGRALDDAARFLRERWLDRADA